MTIRARVLATSVTLATIAALTSVTSELPVASAAEDPVIAAAGDIACPPGVARTTAKCHQGNTADLLQAGNYTAVLPLGDEQYDCGELSAFQSVYDPTWGQFNAKAYPIVGDNEYAGDTCTTPGATGYFTYFGNRASPDQPGCTTACRGYYSYNLGAWHLIALNSECAQPGVGGCSASSQMGTWLKNDLAAHPAACTLAYMHRPYWANGAVSTKHKPLVQMLYDAGVEILLSGHNHFYRRFAAQNPDSVADPNGIRQFVVGTGGVSHSSSLAAMPNIEAQNATTFGVLTLTLHPNSYDFKFIPDATSGTFTDAGSGTCHSGTTPVQQPPTVTTSAASSIGPNAATLNGTVNPQGAATTYYFEYGTTTAYGSQTATISAGAGSTPQNVTATLSDLAPATTYHYRLVASNAAGTSHGTDATFTTMTATGSTPGPVTAAKVVSGSTTDRPISVTVRYGAASGAPTSYRISVINETTGAVTTVTVGGDVLRTKVTGLIAGNLYKAQITAINAAGNGPTVTTTTTATAR